jgi:hypothetical protein
MTAALAVYTTYRGGQAGFGQGPPTLLSKDFRHRFIIAKDNLNVNSLERKWSPDRPRGEKTRKNQYLPELRTNKISAISKSRIFHGFSEQPAFLAQFFL